MMELIALLILMSASSSFQLTGPEKVHGELGGSVTVDCQYDRNYKDHVKQWREGYYYLSSEVVVSTDKPKKGRFSLTDNKTQRIFSVTMDNLTKNDEGYYWCVIEMPTLGQNIKMSVKLEVSEGPVQRSTMGPTTKVTETTEASVTTALTTAFHRTGTTRSIIGPTTWTTGTTEALTTFHSTGTNRDDKLKSHRIWPIFRWLLVGALVICTVSVTCFAEGPVFQASK
ncbi:CMRF35-like molecule 5 isoform X1 [Heterodontus francisci]|uniref:CMRF35-like molecule 5 isoform X1 n=1 Tax=Heterodontus francisci TaxID=7792 RepID=UPI00355B973F